MCISGVWDANWEIQASTGVYSVNSNIHILESTLESGYKSINPGASTILISLM